MELFKPSRLLAFEAVDIEKKSVPFEIFRRGRTEKERERADVSRVRPKELVAFRVATRSRARSLRCNCKLKQVVRSGVGGARLCPLDLGVRQVAASIPAGYARATPFRLSVSHV